eukprot:CAMPEP_0119403962 /NCGR_PEP_ID=MMETSP1334-20130426/143653_1 /TAXON_ID=127549 /ORGANISM="Calcidiscus leptoporus, Strain RCC1130" /LENGTH=1443 /DNA_ID=CAMNT_0007427919 /DNA_START=15 /DNA_END=4346 /DNA_ORIENTATION=+
MVAVEIRFVKAGPSSITLDLHVPAHLEHDSQLRIDKFELQWREARAGAEWATASSSLKLRRCTKGNLKPSMGYVFRARPHIGGEGWGDFGDETRPIRTTLPEVPDGCSEALRVPAIVAAVESQKEAEAAETSARVSARHEAQLLRFVERKAAAATAMQAAVAELAGQQDALRKSVLEALDQVRAHAEERFENLADELLRRSAEVTAQEVRNAVAKAGAEMSAQAEHEKMSWAGTQAIVEGAKAQARKRTVLANEQRLDGELAQRMSDLELRVAPELLQALRAARSAAEEAGGLKSSAALGSSTHTMVRHAVEAACLEAMHEYRLDLEQGTLKEKGKKGAATSLADAMLLSEGDVDDWASSHFAERQHALKQQLHAAICQSLSDMEQRALRRHEAAVAESWLLVETLRCREYAEVNFNSCDTVRKSQLEARKQKLSMLQSLLNSGRDFPAEKQMALSADAGSAARVAAFAENQASEWKKKMANASPWQLERLKYARTEHGGGNEAADDDPNKVQPPPAFIGAIHKDQLRAAMDRATEAASGMCSTVEGAEDGVRLLVDKAIETMVEEATHLEKLHQRYSLREQVAALKKEHPVASNTMLGLRRTPPPAEHERALVPSDAPAGAIDGEDGGDKYANALQLYFEGATARDDDESDFDHVISGESGCSTPARSPGRKLLSVHDPLSEVVGRVWQRLSEAAALRDTDDAQAMMHEAVLIGEAQRSIVAAAQAEQARALSAARAEWDKSRAAEVQNVRERMHLQLHTSLEEAREAREGKESDMINKAVKAAERRMLQQQAKAVEDAVAEERARCHEEAEQNRAAAVGAAVKDAVARCQTARVVAAQQATVERAQKMAYEKAGAELKGEIAAAEKKRAEAEERAHAALSQLEDVKRGTSRAALQAVALAAPVQRQAAESAVRAAVAAEKQKAQIMQQLEVEQAVNRVQKEAAQAQAEAVRKAVDVAKDKAATGTRLAVQTAVAEARLDERNRAQAAARIEVKRAIDHANARAAAEQKRAVSAALESAERARSTAIQPSAVRAVLSESAERSMEVREAAGEMMKRALAEADERHARDKKAAIAAAVEEVVRVRKRAEDRLTKGAAAAAAAEVKREWEDKLARETSWAERRGAAAEAEKTHEKIRQAVEDAVAHTMSRIKPALQKQEEVERAIRVAEERAKELERLRQTSMQERVEKLASEASSQPKAVQEQVRTAVRSAEDRFEKQLSSVHETYKKASDEQQIQIKELLKQAHEHAKQQQQLAVERAVDEVRTGVEEEKRAAMEAAKAAVQMSALQQAEELDAVSVEVAELRAENRMLSERLSEVSHELARAHSTLGIVPSGGGDSSAIVVAANQPPPRFRMLTAGREDAARHASADDQEAKAALALLRRANPALPSGTGPLDPFDVPIARPSRLSVEPSSHDLPTSSDNNDLETSSIAPTILISDANELI